ncbi:translationally-controlled tumor protein [Parasitella parasitica]|nr:translationally-controlled tumor protein [Parasitella parasitica]
MLLFKDIISGDELFSDAYPLKEVDDIVYEVDCAMISPDNADNIDIGANPSAEGGDDEEVADSNTEKVNNVVYSFKLAPSTFDKKTYMSYIKGYMKAIKKKLEVSNPERISIFEKQATTFIKKVLGNFKDYEFYVGESMDPDGMVALLNYREDGIIPYFTFFKDGVKEEKL